MKYKTEFMYENNISVCTLTDNKNRIFIGQAYCHPDDLEFASEFTGCEIALRRAMIKAMRAERDDIKISLQTLKQFDSLLQNSPKFNKYTYQYKMLQRSINRTTSNLTTIKQEITTEVQKLQEYIHMKDVIHNRIREEGKDK